ncbi:MAG: DUF1801 domain-containing protein [Paracoccaceae bacterium]|nr:DUF1801 domain-containing protein [Paracoccaceae bacterium]
MAGKTDTVDAYIAARSAEVAALMTKLRAFVHTSMPGAVEEMQYGVPAFLNAQGVPVVYLFGSKKHVNFGFLRSADLADPDRVLKGSGKPSKHIKLLPGAPIDEALLAGFMAQCADIRP